MIEVGEVRTPEGKDFDSFREVAENDEGWHLSLKNTKKQLFIYSRPTSGTKIQMIKVRIVFDLESSYFTFQS